MNCVCSFSYLGHSNICICVHVEVRGQPWCSSSDAFHLVWVFRQWVLGLELTKCTTWLASGILSSPPTQPWGQEQQPSCLCLLGFQDTHTQVLMLVHQGLYHFNRLPRLHLRCFHEEKRVVEACTLFELATPHRTVTGSSGHLPISVQGSQTLVVLWAWVTRDSTRLEMLLLSPIKGGNHSNARVQHGGRKSRPLMVGLRQRPISKECNEGVISWGPQPGFWLEPGISHMLWI